MSAFTATMRPFLRSAGPRIAAVQRVSPVVRQQLARRPYATETGGAAEGKSSSSTPLIAGLIAAGLLGGGAYWVLTNDSESDPTKIKDAASPKQVDYQAVYNAIAEVLDAEDYDDGSYGPVLVRLAWHASGTYDKDSNTGGSNGATMRFAPESNHGANAGLDKARAKLEPIKKKFPEVTYSDLWTLAGVCAVQEMGGPIVPWRAGRKDGDVANCTPDGRLPDGDKGSDHIRHIFYRMGFNDQEIVALSGAHALGRCHTDRSGFEGPWTFSPTTLTNDYYKLLLEEKWNLRKWNGPIQYEDKKTKSLMMLTTDYALVTDKAFKKYTQEYAKDESRFFDDFSKAFSKLIELGVPKTQLSDVVALKKTEDQSA